MTIESQFQDPDGRRADRFAFAAKVQFRSGSRRASVQVRDISTLGARISGVFLVRENDLIYLKLPMIEPIPRGSPGLTRSNSVARSSVH